MSRLPVTDDDLVACVSCGLCLPHCPTYRITGEESASPRGRIAAMRSVQFDGAPMDASFTEFMDACVQCRGCETACPSSVPFGRLMEGARQALAIETRYQPWWRRIGYRVLGHHRAVLVLSFLLAVAQRMHLLPGRLALPRIPLFQRRLRTSGIDAWLFTGCVMDAWSRSTHAAAQRVMEAAGAGVRIPRANAGCCGALTAHAGLVDSARRQATRTMRAYPGDAPIVVDSAGCGAMLKDYGHLLGTPDAEHFAARVVDIHEWLAPRRDKLPSPGDAAPRPRVAVQDPCHLRHVQRAHHHVRTVLASYVDVVELDDDGLCCGAGGAYAAHHPDMAGQLRARKVGAVARTGAPVVASANPGCRWHLAAAGLVVRHPIELLDEAINGR